MNKSLLATWVAIVLSGCSTVLGADELRTESRCRAGTVVAATDLDLHVRNLPIGALVQVKLVAPPDERVLGLAIVERTRSSNVRIVMPAAIPPGSDYFLELFVNYDQSPEFSAATDLLATVPVCPSGEIFVSTNSNLELSSTPIAASGDDLLIQVNGTADLRGEVLQLSVSDVADRTLGLYRFEATAAISSLILLAGIAQAGSEYTVTAARILADEAVEVLASGAFVLDADGEPLRIELAASR